MSSAGRRNVWPRHFYVALIYAIGYVLLRQVSWTHWVLIAGYRVSVLALVPYRYWPALLLGELGPIAYTSFACLDTFGPLWVSLMLIPPIGLAMPVVKYCRDRLQMVPQRGPVNVLVLLTCTLVMSLLWTAANSLILATARLPAGTAPLDFGEKAAHWFIGNYLGILTLAPLTLVIREAWPQHTNSLRWIAERAFRSNLVRQSIFYVLPALTVLVLLARLTDSQQIRKVACMSMFVPVVVFALRHRWYGAAVGGAMASLAVVLAMPARYDATTLQAEVVTAFTARSMMLLGGGLTVFRLRAQAATPSPRATMDLAQRINDQAETQLRQTSQAIELISETMNTTTELMFEQLRKIWPAVDSRELRRRANVTREQLWQLSDGLYPLALRQRGLLETLREGAIARALGARDIGYWCAVTGALEDLPEPMQLAIHRLVNEMVCYSCDNHSVSATTLKIRIGSLDGRRWALLRLISTLSTDPKYRLLGIPLNYRLGASGLGLTAIKARAALYDGIVRIRPYSQGELISVLLRATDDVSATSIDIMKAPTQEEPASR